MHRKAILAACQQIYKYTVVWGGLASLTCVQDVWQDSNYTQLTVLTGLLHHVFIQDLTQKHL